MTLHLLILLRSEVDDFIPLDCYLENIKIVYHLICMGRSLDDIMVISVKKISEGFTRNMSEAEQDRFREEHGFKRVGPPIQDFKKW